MASGLLIPVHLRLDAWRGEGFHLNHRIGDARCDPSFTRLFSVQSGRSGAALDTRLGRVTADLVEVSDGENNFVIRVEPRGLPQGAAGFSAMVAVAAMALRWLNATTPTFFECGTAAMTPLEW